MLAMIAIGLLCVAGIGAAAWIALPYVLEQPDYEVLRKDGEIELRAVVRGPNGCRR